MQNQLKNVQHIQASDGAFAAILGDGSVVTWGEAEDGGDSSSVHVVTWWLEEEVEEEDGEEDVDLTD